MQEGEKRALKVGDKDEDKVLIAKYQGKLYAVGNFCSHFGVPLEGGAMFEDKVLCPAHSAGFSVVTGEPEGGPGLNGLPSFPVVEKDGKHYVQLPQGGLPKSVAMKLSKRDPENSTHFVIIGGGAAGLNAAETLRQSGFTGRITMLTNDDSVPYDRTLLTKATAVGDPANWKLRSDQYLADADIDVTLKTSVYSVNAAEKKVITTKGDHIKFDKLLIATGSQVRVPDVKGTDLKGVFKLRTGADMLAIKAAVQSAKNVVVIGGSFIGSETAASLKMNFKDKIKIDIVNSGESLFNHSLGTEVGKMLQKEHETNGVIVHNNARLQEIHGQDGTVSSVTLSDGTKLDADLVILGTGVKPRTAFLKDSGITMAEDGSIIVDPFMQTNYVDIFAAGDIATYPYWPTGQRMRTEHWNVALEQGTNAAFNMLGKLIPYSYVPFFWTRHYNKSVQFVGTNEGHTEVHYSGDVAGQKFVAYYIDAKDRVIGACGMNNGQAILTIMEAIHQNVMPRGSEIKSGKETPQTIATRIKQNTGGSKCRRADCCRKKAAAAQ